MYAMMLCVGTLLVTVLLYHRASLAIWSISLFLYWAAYFSLLGYSSSSSIFFIVIFAILLFLQISIWRRRFIISPIFKLYAKMLPSMSQTEKEAISAGSVAWEGEIFKGKPNWHTFLKHPVCRLTEEEQAFLDGPTEELCTLINDWEITHQRFDLSEEVWIFLKKNGYFGLIIPKSYGGKEFSAYAHSQIMVKVSGISVAAAVTLSVPNSLGPAELLLHYGTAEQQQYYLPRLARGDEIPCFALTSQDAGSDASAMTDYGIVTEGEFDGKTIIGIQLNWNKRYITLAPIATVIGLAFKLYDPDHLLGDENNLGITCALIPSNTPGVTIGRRHFPLNCPFQNGPIQGKDVFIPFDWIIGGRAQIGKGWRMLVECLAAGRAITLPSSALGGAKVLSLAASAYTRIRSQFGLPIGRFEGIQEPLARIVAYTYLMDAARQFTIARVDAGEKPSIASAIIKYHVTELGRKAAIHGMDIHGGKGICLGPNNYLARGYQFAPIAITVEGANILTRNLIIFGQGVIRCHPYLYAEMQAVKMKDPKAGLCAFDHAFSKHVTFVLSNIVSSVVLALTSARLVSVPHIKMKRYLQHATRFASAFALLSDISMLIYGADLKRKESISSRLGDILSYLYLLSAVIKHYHDEGEHDSDLSMATFACDLCLYEVQHGFTSVLKNFSNRLVANVLACVIFPLGKRFHEPSDACTSQLASQMMQPSAMRKRLGSGISVKKTIFNDIEDAMQKVINAKEINKTIKAAAHEGNIHGYTFEARAKSALLKNIITEAEYQTVIMAEEAKNKILKVDDFSNEELSEKIDVL